MFASLSEFQSMSVHAFKAYAFAHALWLIVVSRRTTGVMHKGWCSSVKAVRVLSLWRESPSLWRAKVVCIAAPQGPASPPEQGSSGYGPMFKGHSATWERSQHIHWLPSSGPSLGLAGVCQQMLGFKYLTAQPGTPVLTSHPSFTHLMQNLTLCPECARRDRHNPLLNTTLLCNQMF